MRLISAAPRSGEGEETPGIPRVLPSPRGHLRLARDAALASVIECEVSCDTLGVWLRRTPATTILRELARRNRGRLVTTMRVANGCVLGLPQPTQAARDLIKLIDPRHTVFRLDLAVNFVTATADEAHAVAEFVRKHLVQLHRRKGHAVTVHETTTYFRGLGASRNVAIYDDQLSKRSKRPCAHLEIRLNDRRSCLAFGIARATDNVDDLAGFLDRNAVLAHVVPETATAVLNDLLSHNTDPNAPCCEWTGLTDEERVRCYIATGLDIRGVALKDLTVENMVGLVKAQSWRDYTFVRKLRSRRFGLVQVPLASLCL